jgi:hypothetical protein
VSGLVSILGSALRLAVEIAAAAGKDGIAKKADALLVEAGFPTYHKKAKAKVVSIRRRFGLKDT